jgi:hypothetical protein
VDALFILTVQITSALYFEYTWFKSRQVQHMLSLRIFVVFVSPGTHKHILIQFEFAVYAVEMEDTRGMLQY